MRVSRLACRPLSERTAQAFANAEEAWLWYSRCQLARIEGVRFTADSGDVARPCDPDDIYRAVARLCREGRLASAHVAVLGRFGCRLNPPDPWAGDAERDARLWAEAMDRLTLPLREKGIVA
ncbi:MAG TPA: hypothetical protein VK196_05425 [Magnetospirillum sp.]|nr:hypothetical protein [Magnetospirillum sp.]